jgi:hypothetical protein
MMGGLFFAGLFLTLKLGRVGLCRWKNGLSHLFMPILMRFGIDGLMELDHWANEKSAGSGE